MKSAHQLRVCSSGMSRIFKRIALTLLTVVFGSANVHADIVTDWNIKAAEIASKLPGPPPGAVRVMANTQVAVYEAVNAITKRHAPFRTSIEAAPGASVDAAVAAATRGILSKSVPAQLAATEAAYQTALALVPESAAKTDGITVGEKAAAAVLALRASDATAFSIPDAYRPHTTAGHYVPTIIPVAQTVALRKPWVMTSPQQFPPGPPPALNSETWARDFNEVKAMGGANSTQRTKEQTDIARFWEATMPVIYWPIVRSVAVAPGHDVTHNARLLAAAGVAMDDSMIAIFDAKYTYNFWRPITAIRNADIDGNDATTRDAGWTPFIDTPMHPEYPCAHCIVCGSLSGVLEAEIGNGPTPPITTSSPTAAGATRTWTRLGDLVMEVQVARIYDGVHYRTSGQVGAAMGKQIGELAAKAFFK